MTTAKTRQSQAHWHKTVGIWVGLLALLVVLSTLFIMGRGTPAAHHIEVMREFAIMEESNAVINEELIKTRYRKNISYDKMVQASANLLHSSQQVALILKLGDAQKLTPAYKKLLAGIHSKREYLEEYKSINAVFHNSWGYFPQACTDAITALKHQEEQPLLQQLIQNLLQKTLLGTINDSPTVQLASQNLLANLESLSPSLPPEVRKTLEPVLLHGQQIMRVKEHVDAVFLDAYNSSLVQDISQFFVLYEQVHTLADNRASFYLNILFLLAALMAISILWFFMRLKKTAMTLQQTVRSLEFQKFALDQHAIVSIADKHGTIIYANEKFCQISGYEMEELLGKNHRIINSNTHPSSFFEEMWRSISQGNVWRGDIKNSTKTGGFYWVSSTIVPFLDDTGKPFQYVSIRNDLTQRKTLEEDLIHARDAAEMGARTKTAFLANMSHEIRTPMNAVLGFSEVVLQDTSLSSETQKHVRTIYSSAKSLLGIINDILDVSKMDSGKFILETVCFHLPNALAETLQTVEHRAKEKNLHLTVAYHAQLPKRFMGDPSRLRQVILNLVGNAIKFTDKGEVSLAVAWGDAPDMLHFAITDTGIGMSATQIDKIFESFSQADQSTSRRFGGTGLGTTISKQIVEMMGGKIWVESVEGKGSTFHFSVHMAEVIVTEGCLYEDGSSIEDGYVSPRAFKILLAEDIEANATLAKLRLAQQGHTVYWVKDGLEVVEAFQQNPYDLILMDVMMPRLDGLDATRNIRTLEKAKTKSIPIPILALTASIMREDHEKCLDAGMDGVLAKPVDFKVLFTTIEHAVPEGGGTANTNIQLNISVDADINFSPVKGIIDHDRAIKTWRDPLVFAKALISFAAERKTDAVEMTRLLLEHADDNEPARKVAHALKGVAGNLAINQVAHLGIKIDDALKSGQRQDAERMIGDLHQALEVTATAIANLRLPVADTDTDTDTDTKTFDPEVVRGLFGALLVALDELNPDAVEPVLIRLGEYIGVTDLATIQREVEAFDFYTAKDRVDALTKKLGLVGQPS